MIRLGTGYDPGAVIPLYVYIFKIGDAEVDD
jgi:hypothetical protein